MSYRVPVLDKFAWQPPVASVTTTIPGTPDKTMRHIVGEGAGTAWAGQDGKIAWWDGEAWVFDTPTEGWRVFDKNLNEFLFFDGATWNSGTTVSKLTLHDASDNEALIDSDADRVRWDLLDNDSTSLQILTATGVNMLTFDTTNDFEKLSTVADLILESGVIDVSAEAAASLTINDAAGSFVIKDGSENIITVNGNDDSVSFAQDVNVGNDLSITGNLTVSGTTTTINTEQLTIEDPIITLNQGGLAADSGLEIYESTTIVGWLKTDDVNDNWLLKATGDAGELTIDINVDSKLAMSADLTVENTSVIDQDLTQDSLSAKFAKLTLTSGTALDLATNPTGTGVILKTAVPNALNFTDGGLSILNIDTDDNKVDIANLNVDGNSLIGGTLGVTGATTLAGLSAGATSLDSLIVDTSISAGSLGVTGATVLAGLSAGETTLGSTTIDGLGVTNDVSIGGTLGVTGGATFLAGIDVRGNIIDDGGNSVTVANLQKSYDSRAKYDSLLGCVIFDELALDAA